MLAAAEQRQHIHIDQRGKPDVSSGSIPTIHVARRPASPERDQDGSDAPGQKTVAPATAFRPATKTAYIYRA